MLTTALIHTNHTLASAQVPALGSIIDPCVKGNRLIERVDGTISIEPKHPAYVIGEYVIRPLLRQSFSLASSIKDTFDRIFPPFPAAAAASSEMSPAHSYLYSHPENLAFRGGGAKGYVYPGVVRALEETGALPCVKRIAGTSAGGIAGTFIALGMTGDEISEIFQEKSLVDFIFAETLFGSQEQTTTEKAAKAFSTIKSGISLYLKATGKDGLGGIFDVIKQIIEFKGLFKGDSFREWVDNKIYQKTGVRHCTFGELSDFIRAGRPYKHLYITGTKITGSMPANTVFNSEDPQWRDMIISDAVLITAAIPGVIHPHFPHFKDSRGERIPREDLGHYVDGGLLKNFPIDTFDRREFVEKDVHPDLKSEFMNNRKTVGFNLYNPDHESDSEHPKSIYHRIKVLAKTIIKSQDAHHATNEFNPHRTVNINTYHVKPLAFWKDPTIIAKLEESGKNATLSFFAERKKRRDDLEFFEAFAALDDGIC